MKRLNLIAANATECVVKYYLYLPSACGLLKSREKGVISTENVNYWVGKIAMQLFVENFGK